jgi:hypothetical protein
MAGSPASTAAAPNGVTAAAVWSAMLSRGIPTSIRMSAPTTPTIWLRTSAPAATPMIAHSPAPTMVPAATAAILPEPRPGPGSPFTSGTPSPTATAAASAPSTSPVRAQAPARASSSRPRRPLAASAAGAAVRWRYSPAAITSPNRMSSIGRPLIAACLSSTVRRSSDRVVIRTLAMMSATPSAA